MIMYLGLIALLCVVVWVGLIHNRLSKLQKENKQIKSILKKYIINVKDTIVGSNVVESGSIIDHSLKENIYIHDDKEVDISLINNIDKPVKKESTKNTNKLWSWFLHDRPLKVGALFVIFGVMYFLTYAIMNQWIKPELRIVLGSCVGILLVVRGIYRSVKQQINGSIVVGLGMAIYLLSLSAGRYYFDMLDPSLMMFLMSLMVGAVGWISVKNDYEPLAIVTMVFGSLVPILVVPSFFDPTNALLYFGLIAVVSLIVSYYRDRTWLFLSTIIVYGVFVLGFFAYSTPITQDDQYLGFGISSLFMLSNILKIMKTKNIDVQGFVGSVLNILFLLLWILLLYPSDLDVSYLLMCVVICVGVALYFYQHSYNKNIILTYVSFAFVFLGVRLFNQLDGIALTYSYLLLSGLLILGTMYSTYSLSYNKYIDWSFLLPAFMFLSSVTDISYSGIPPFNSEISLLSLVFVGVTGIYLYLRRRISVANDALMFSTLAGRISVFLWGLMFICGLLFLFWGVGGVDYFSFAATIGVFVLYFLADFYGFSSDMKTYIIAGLIVPLVPLVEYSTKTSYVLSVLLLLIVLFYVIVNEKHRSIRNRLMLCCSFLFLVLVPILLSTMFPSSLYAFFGFFITSLSFVTASLYKQKIYWPLILGPVFFILDAVFSVIMSSQRDSGIVHEASLSLIGVLTILYGLYVYIADRIKQNQSSDKLSTITLVCVEWIGYIFLFASVWLFSHGLFEQQLGTLVSLGIYSLVGIRQYIRGRNTGIKTSTLLGGVILAGVTLRVVFIELQGLEMIRKIVTLFVLGAIFIASGFINPKMK